MKIFSFQAAIIATVLSIASSMDLSRVKNPVDGDQSHLEKNPTPRPSQDIFDQKLERHDTNLYPDYFLAKVPVKETVTVEEPVPTSAFAHEEVDPNAQMAEDLRFSKI